MATLYYNAAVDTDWSTLGNWWADDSFTTPAVSLPTSGDDVVISGQLDYASPYPTVNKFTCVGCISTKISVTVNDHAEFMDESCNLGTINGKAYFYDNSGNGWNFTPEGPGQITGDSIFNDNSYNCGMLSGANATFNDYSGVRETTPNGNNGFVWRAFYLTCSNLTFNDYSYNESDTSSVGTVTFNDESVNYFNSNSNYIPAGGSSPHTPNVFHVRFGGNDLDYGNSPNYPFASVQKAFATAYHLVPKLSLVDGRKCASFNGEGDYLQVPPGGSAFDVWSSGGSGTTQGDFTIELWFYMNEETSGTYTLLSNMYNKGYGENGHPTWVLSVGTENNGTENDNGIGNVVSFFSSSNGGCVGFTSTKVIPGQWNHVAVTRDYNGDKTIKIWYNGNLESNHAINGEQSWGESSSGIDLGYDYENGNFFDGYINSVRIFNDASIYWETFTPEEDLSRTLYLVRPSYNGSGNLTASVLLMFDPDNEVVYPQRPFECLIQTEQSLFDGVDLSDPGPGRIHGSATEWPRGIRIRGVSPGRTTTATFLASDMQNATTPGGATLGTDGFETDGTGDGRVDFDANNTRLFFEFTSRNSMDPSISNGMYKVKWAEGSTVLEGYVYLEFSTFTPFGGSTTYTIKVLPVVEPFVGDPLAGTWKFPAKFTELSGLGNIVANGRDAVWDYGEGLAITTSTPGRTVDIVSYGGIEIENINSNGGMKDGGAGPGSGGEVRINNVMADNINVNGGDGANFDPFFLTQGGGGNFTGINSNVKDIHLNPGTGGYARDGGDTKLIGSKAKNIYSHGGLSTDCGGGGSGGDLFMLNSTVGEVACYGYPGDGCGSGGSNGGYATIINSTVDWLRLNGASDGTSYGQGGNAVVIDSSIMVADVTNFGLPSEMCNDIYGHPCEGEQIPGYAAAPNHDYDGSIKTHTTKKQAINGPGFLG